MSRTSHRKRSNRRKGGANGPGAANPSSYDSASTYMRATVGTGNQQWGNVFESSKNSSNSNSIVGLQGQRAGKRGGTKKRRGGYWSQVINSAIIPFTLLGLQQTYRRKKGGRKTRRH
jgi:hypothetical protein